MDDIFTNLKRTFNSGNILAKLIYINVGLFVMIRLASVVLMLFNLSGFPFLQYLQMPSSPELLLYRPWTIITYMFTHFDFLHILFNMLWLYWFGGLFLTFFSERQLGGLYLLGGIAGAILFLVAYNIFPYFRTVAAYSYLMGASASVMAIVFAVSFYRKDLEIGLFLIGRVKLLYLALFTFVIDLLAITSTNAGGHIAHIGGALFGIWFAARIKDGKDLTAPMNRLLDRVVNLGKRKPKMRVTYKRSETDYEYNARKHQETVDLDAILDKLKRSGYESLSAEEKKKLFDASKKMSERFKAIRILFKSVVGTANVIVILLFIASAFSDRISPDRSVLFSYLGLGFPVFCVLNLCFIIHWLFLWEWRFVLIGLCSFLICRGPVTRYFPFHGRVSDIPKENVLKVLTYNVMGFGYKDHTEDSPNPIIRYIANSGADIVCLQEYAVGASKNFLTDQKIANALKMYRYRSIIPIGTSGTLKFNIAVFSKYPIFKSRKIQYESSFNGSSIHELDINGKKLTLINNHLESFKLTMEDRGHYSAFIKNLNSETLDGLRNSIEQKLGPAFRIRARQARAVAEEIKKIDTDYILVCGDFNDTPVSYAHRTVQGALKDAYAASGRGVGVTYNENFFWFRIDNILHSANMKPMNCTVDKVRYSDHYPLWCYLQLKMDK